ncbi:MAG TPA: protein-glutamate O-methyltransferase CheR [bacterium]|jgi:chemotaxis protein methyltransferase CheR|nr:protein-glutamate O-methyltransferase CheR [bacterium]
MLPAPPEDRGFDELKRRLIDMTGWDLGRFKEAYLRRRVATRVRATGSEDWRSYGELLKRDPLELEKLRDRLTVNVTEFFRDSDFWDVLEAEVLPPLLEAAAQGSRRELRVWSAGCSSGEEPYSLALMFLKAAQKQAKGVRVRILASDIDEAVLARAKEGRYPAEALRLVPGAHRRDAFLEDGAHSRVAPWLRKAVAFRRLDLFSSPPPPALDLVLCRNVMIYFSRDLQQRLLRAFHQALRPGGYFATGKTETVLGPARGGFQCTSARARIFQRT